MERIREAVQRARQLRGDPKAILVHGARPVSQRAHAGDTVPGTIDYTTTRTIAVPRGVLEENRVVAGFDPCQFSDACKVLSTRVAHLLREKGWNTLAVTSPRGSEGKSLVATNLATSLAMEYHQTALLVDADLRRPSARRCLGLPDGPGLSDYLFGDATVESLLVNPGIRGLVVLSGGTPQLNSSEMLGSNRMAGLVQELRTRYASRIIVFDMPPLLEGADVLAFAPHVEAALLVVEEGQTSRDDVARAVDLLRGTQLIGTVLNKAHVERGRYETARTHRDE